MIHIDFKELNHLRILRCKENYITKTYSIHQNIFQIVEIPGFLFRSTWNERQNSLLKYLLENEVKFKDKNILIMFDGVGFCGLVSYFIGANVVICEEKEYWFLIETNMKMNNHGLIPKIITPLDYEQQENNIYDYVIISETIYSKTFFDKIRVGRENILNESIISLNKGLSFELGTLIVTPNSSNGISLGFEK